MIIKNFKNSRENIDIKQIFPTPAQQLAFTCKLHGK